MRKTETGPQPGVPRKDQSDIVDYWPATWSRKRMGELVRAEWPTAMRMVWSLRHKI